MKTVVIGATGHIGTYLVPRLVAAGHQVVAVSRGEREPYRAAGEWAFVERVEIDRKATEADGSFGDRIAALEPDAVIDLICFTVDSARHLREALDGRIEHFLHCGTIWVHGPAEVVPTTEDAPRRPFGDYGVQKAEIESYLLRAARHEGFPAAVLHPGHIVGPGWVPLNPQANFDASVYERLAAGERVTLPDRGLETVHHVHADDVAQAFERAVARREASLGESFHVVSPRAVTLRGFARAVARWFGREAELAFLPWLEWTQSVAEEHVEATLDHIARSPSVSIAKARRLLGYEPRYTSFEGVREAVRWLIEHGQVEVAEG